MAEEAKSKETLREAYANVFKSEVGKLVLADLMAFTGFFSDSFEANSPDVTAYYLGRRSVALRIMENAGVSAADAHDAIETAQYELGV